MTLFLDEIVSFYISLYLLSKIKCGIKNRVTFLKGNSKNPIHNPPWKIRLKKFELIKPCYNQKWPQGRMVLKSTVSSKTKGDRTGKEKKDPEEKSNHQEQAWFRIENLWPGWNICSWMRWTRVLFSLEILNHKGTKWMKRSHSVLIIEETNPSKPEIEEEAEVAAEEE